jgi:hypothetical protein
MAPRKTILPFAPRKAFVVLFLAGLVACPPAQAWGPQAHELVTRWAIQTLPQPLQSFFGAHTALVLGHVNDPALWLKKDRYEKFRQYIYLDAYGRFPYLKLPHSYKAAIGEYGSHHIARDGTLPWQIGEFSLRVTNDMRARNWDGAVIDGAALAYYVADANDPLLTTQNFDGQLTDENGLVDRFGSDLVDRYKTFIVFRSVTADKIADPTEYAFTMAIEANSWVDRVLLADRDALDDLPSYNEDYFDRFYTRVGSIVSQQLSHAAHDIGSYWYTAWLNAGEPAVPAQ